MTLLRQIELVSLCAHKVLSKQVQRLALTSEEQGFLAWGGMWLVMLLKNGLGEYSSFSGPLLTLDHSAEACRIAENARQKGTGAIPSITLQYIVRDVEIAVQHLLQPLNQRATDPVPSIEVALGFFYALHKEVQKELEKLIA